MVFYWRHENGDHGETDMVGHFARDILIHYIKRNLDKTAESLNEDIESVNLGNHKRIELRDNVPEHRQVRYFMNNPIPLNNGEIVVVSREWGATGNSLQQLEEFKAKMKTLGYTTSNEPIVDNSEWVILFNISATYNDGMTDEALYEATRGTWKMGERRNEAKYAIAVANGIIREVYRIGRWHIGGTTVYNTRPQLNTIDNSRWEFTGTVAGDEIRKTLINRPVDGWGQNPIHYKRLAELMDNPKGGNMANNDKTSEHLTLLRQFYQIIFYGPPGTGKTYAAKGILAELFGVQKDNLPDLQGKQWDIVQFHPSYNYEDFVRGVKVETKDKQVAYETVNRTFGEMCKRANNHPNNKHVLIIDEINRANVSAVLGELIYALEYRGESVKTPYSVDGEQNIMIPKNLYIIGTMNTADRTIGQIDYAVRRRFAFIDCLPNPEIITNSVAKTFFELVDSLFDKSNEYLSPDFGANDVRIGHSYFLPKDKKGFVGDELANKILYQVVPILWEYFKDGVLTNSKSTKKAIEEIEKEAKKLLAGESEEFDSSAKNSEYSGDDTGNFLLHWKTNDNLFGFNGMGRTALNIIKDFIKNNNPENVDEILQKLSLPKDTIVPVPTDDFNSKSKNFFQHKEDIINLRDGNQYVVAYGWTNKPDKPKWKEFAEKIKEHGYVISNCHFVNVGEYGSEKRRGWEECKKFGFLAAGGVYEGGNTTHSSGLKKLQPKEIVFAYRKIDKNQKGCIAYGEIIEKAVPIRGFMIAEIPLLEHKTADGSLYKNKYPKAQETAHDDKDCDWILRVKWIKILPDGEFVQCQAPRNTVWHRAKNIHHEQLHQKFVEKHTEE